VPPALPARLPLPCRASLAPGPILQCRRGRRRRAPCSDPRSSWASVLRAACARDVGGDARVLLGAPGREDADCRDEDHARVRIELGDGGSSATAVRLEVGVIRAAVVRTPRKDARATATESFEREPARSSKRRAFSLRMTWSGVSGFARPRSFASGGWPGSSRSRRLARLEDHSRQLGPPFTFGERAAQSRRPNAPARRAVSLSARHPADRTALRPSAVARSARPGRPPPDSCARRRCVGIRSAKGERGRGFSNTRLRTSGSRFEYLRCQAWRARSRALT